MKVPTIPTFGAALSCVGLASFAMASTARDSVVTAVFSRSFNHYERPLRADGAPETQTYVVARGGYAPGLGADPSIDDVKFAGIVQVLGKYLAKQGYYPAKDARKADVMLLIHWGKTIPFEGGVHQGIMDEGLRGFDLLQQMGFGGGDASGLHLAAGAQGQSPDLVAMEEVHPTRDGLSLKEPLAQVTSALIAEAEEQRIEGIFNIQFAQRMRYAADERNANLLGYTAELKYRDNPSLYAGGGTAYHDLLGEIETERYYVSVTAYDFQDALRHKNKKGLWRTVASIDVRDNRFDERLTAMVDKASRHFGRDSERRIREFEYTPHVSFGDLQVLGVGDKERASRTEQ